HRRRRRRRRPLPVLGGRLDPPGAPLPAPRRPAAARGRPRPGGLTRPRGGAPVAPLRDFPPLRAPRRLRTCENGGSASPGDGPSASGTEVGEPWRGRDEPVAFGRRAS